MLPVTSYLPPPGLDYPIRQEVLPSVDINLVFQTRDVHSIRLIEVPENAIDLYFDNRAYLTENLDFLRFIASRVPLDSLEEATLSQIALYATFAECDLLFRFGAPLDARLLLDTAIIQSEMYLENMDILDKIRLLTMKGAGTPKSSYFHFISEPSLILAFQSIGLNPDECIDGFRPIELAHTADAVLSFASFGIDENFSLFLKSSRAHKKVLEEVGFHPGLEEREKWQLLLNAALAENIRAFIALFSEGINLNWQEEVTGWTLLHYLFSQLTALDRPYEEIVVSNKKVRFIHILMKYGAIPLRDSLNRSPIMCLSYEHNLCTPIIDYFLHFEAKAGGFSPIIFRDHFLKLRSDPPLPTNRGHYEDPALKRSAALFNDFWAHLN
jgi:hypothetical protein